MERVENYVMSQLAFLQVIGQRDYSRVERIFDFVRAYPMKTEYFCSQVVPNNLHMFRS